MTSPRTHDLRRFLGHLLLFLLPVVGLYALEQVALMRGWLTFRAWEQLVALPPTTHPRPPFPGFFYPRQRLTRTEQGDLGFHSGLAHERTVTWQTDRYGYRNADAPNPPAVVIVGDSMIAGASLDQSEILSTVLARDLGVAVVNLSPTSAGAVTVLAQRRFLDHHPKVVIEGMSERLLERARSCDGMPSPVADPAGDGLLDQLAVWWWVTRDRYLKQPFRQWAESRYYNARIPSVVGTDQRTLFARGDDAHKADLGAIDRGTQNLGRCGALLATQGIAYLPFIVPDKETIYWDLLPSHRKPVTYGRALAGLGRAGLPAIDLEGVFAAERAQSTTPLYPSDESHWSARAVVLTSRLLVPVLHSMGLFVPPAVRGR